MDIEEIRELFKGGIDCSQVVTGSYEQETNLDKETLWKMAAAFGGGMQCGEMCGAVTGAYIVIGLVCGHSEISDFKQKTMLQGKIQAFEGQFLEKYNSCICRELLGYNIANPVDMKKILEKGLLFDFCPKVVEDTLQILENIL